MAHQAPLFTGLSWQEYWSRFPFPSPGDLPDPGIELRSPALKAGGEEYWSGLPFPSPGDLPDPGIEPGSPALESDALTSEPPGKPCTAMQNNC